MAEFNVTATSTACATSSRIITVTYKFAERQIVYYINKAAKGILEKICIKKVKIIERNDHYYVGLYIDTLNGAWAEGELCLEAEARSLAIAFLERQQAELEAAIQNCGRFV